MRSLQTTLPMTARTATPFPTTAVTVLRHVPDEMLGTLRTVLGRAGLGWSCVDLFREVPQDIRWEHSAGLIVLGGPMNVDDVDAHPWLVPEVDWIRAAVEAELPVLGICLGAQLLAKALGAPVRANRVKEIGWYEIELTPEAADDRLFAGCEPSQTVFQWHGDTFDLPAGAAPLAQSKHCRRQAFRWGDRVYALQFHVEVTAEIIEMWLDKPRSRRELAELDYIDPAAIREQTPRALPQMTALAERVLGRFVAMCLG